jgi:hypothetical protein
VPCLGHIQAVPAALASEAAGAIAATVSYGRPDENSRVLYAMHGAGVFKRNEEQNERRRAGEGRPSLV